MYNTSDICSPTPPPGMLLIKYSSSVGSEKPPNHMHNSNKLNKLNNFNDLKEAKYDFTATQIQSFLTVSIRFHIQFLIIKLTITIKLFTIIKIIIFITIMMIIMIKKSLYQTNEHLEMMFMLMFMVLEVNYNGQYFEEDMKDEFEEN